MTFSARARRHLQNNIWGIVAVFIALSGSAYAAASVESADIVNESVVSRDIQDGSINSTDIANNELVGKDIKESTLAMPAALGATDFEFPEARSAQNSAPYHTATAKCPAGTDILSGGGTITAQNALDNYALVETAPQGNGWTTAAIEVGDAAGSWSVFAFAVCADLG